MDVNEWLLVHDAISMNWIEKKLGITTGTLRRGRVIPERYVEEVGKLLRDYGYSMDMVAGSGVVLKSGEVVKNTVVSQNVRKVVEKVKPSKPVSNLSYNDRVDIAKRIMAGEKPPEDVSDDITEVIVEPVEEDVVLEEEPVERIVYHPKLVCRFSGKNGFDCKCNVGSVFGTFKLNEDMIRIGRKEGVTKGMFEEYEKDGFESDLVFDIVMRWIDENPDSDIGKEVKPF